MENKGEDNMAKFAFFNDTNKEIRIHPATKIHGTVCDMSVIKPLEIREFELPEGTYAWVKQWDNGTILVSPTRDDVSDDNEPKHMGKYPIDFSFTEKKTGKIIADYCEEALKEPNIEYPVYIMLTIIKDQVDRYLSKNDE